MPSPFSRRSGDAAHGSIGAHQLGVRPREADVDARAHLARHLGDQVDVALESLRSVPYPFSRRSGNAAHGSIVRTGSASVPARLTSTLGAHLAR